MIRVLEKRGRMKYFFGFAYQDKNQSEVALKKEKELIDAINALNTLEVKGRRTFIGQEDVKDEMRKLRQQTDKLLK